MTDREVFDAWRASLQFSVDPLATWLAWQAATAAERERINDELWDAVVQDCENGVKWLNESASEKLETSYPELWKALGSISKGPTP